MTFLSAYHDSRDNLCRQPFGAVPCGMPVTLALRLHRADQVHRCDLRLRPEGEGRQSLSMRPVSEEMGAVWYQITITTPTTPTLLWYDFMVETSSGTLCYGCPTDATGGEGVLSTTAGAYQITVYRPWQVPAWYRQGIIYQIYVDRFAREESWARRLDPQQWRGRRTLLHLDWREAPAYIRDRHGDIVHWDIFGGSLLGIVEKLPYLVSLGVTVLYLNPIFEAASNHKYDTGDYLRVDPAYGSDEDFDTLVAACLEWGIAIILDGVFSHTGADSRYFNRYDRYPTLGAYQSPSSPYYAWYRFRHYPDDYESWWGVRDLPNVEENVPSYRAFIFEEEGSVVRYWLRRGIKGWRLDVADELPDDFIRDLRAAMHREDAAAVLIGEVWEDASHKISYGQRRRYLLGEELDGTMNYPLRTIFCDFVQGYRNSDQTTAALLTLMENYPPPAQSAMMNLLGTHDTVRILTQLAGGRRTEVAEDNWRKAQRCLRLLVLLQMTFSGVPAVYYGDEAGLEGGGDPDNRRPFPWGEEDAALLDYYRQLIGWRREYAVLTTGELTFLPTSISSLLVYRRSLAAEEIVVAVNRGEDGVCAYRFEARDDCDYFSLYSGERMVVKDGFLELALAPLSGEAIYGQKRKKRPPLPRGAGVLLPLFSLPGPFAGGTFGDGYAFVDWLAAAGQSLWQLLPLQPVGAGYSPYSNMSAMALNPLLIDYGDWRQQGLLSAGEIERTCAEITLTADRVDYEAAAALLDALGPCAYASFRGGPDYERFCNSEQFWLDDYCLYLALKKRFAGDDWPSWPAPYRQGDAATLTAAKQELAADIDYHRFLQFTCDKQWRSLKAYAAQKGIAIVGDLPFYVDGDSVDTWRNPHLFTLDERGRPTYIAGVPPDDFAPAGQHWGHPLYNWQRLAEDDFAWWQQRLARALSLYDYVRLDHFRGFAAYWAIPAASAEPSAGYWWPGPGGRFFEVIDRLFATPPLIVEDLGHITPAVRLLKERFDFPGNQVFQFGCDGSVVKDVYYSGTHDHETLQQWLGKEQGEDACRSQVASLYDTAAAWLILPLQDILSLDRTARMNTPGTNEGNWCWRLGEEQLTASTAQWLRQLAKKNGRLREKK